MNVARSGGHAQGILIAWPWALLIPSQSLQKQVSRNSQSRTEAYVPSTSGVDTSPDTELRNEVDGNVTLDGDGRYGSGQQGGSERGGGSELHCCCE